MYPSYIMKRTQIYLDPAQADALAERSRIRGVTASAMIRDAIVQYLAGPANDAAELAGQRAALRDGAGTIPRLPDGVAYVEAARTGDRIRDQALEERWRSR
jgi:hypothetical protein